LLPVSFRVPVAFHVLGASLQALFAAAGPVVSLHDLAAGGEDGLVDAGFALFEFGPAVFPFGFKGRFRAGDAFGQFGGLFLVTASNTLFSAPIRVRISLLSFSSWAAKILEGAFEPVQKREHFIGSQMSIHNHS